MDNELNYIINEERRKVKKGSKEEEQKKGNKKWQRIKAIHKQAHKTTKK